jgi:hypothetical protein
LLRHCKLYSLAVLGHYQVLGSMASLVNAAKDGLRRSARLAGRMTLADESFEAVFSVDKGVTESALPFTPISMVSAPASVSSPSTESADSGASQETTEQKIVSFHAVMLRRSHVVRMFLQCYTIHMPLCYCVIKMILPQRVARLL